MDQKLRDNLFVGRKAAGSPPSGWKRLQERCHNEYVIDAIRGATNTAGTSSSQPAVYLEAYPNPFRLHTTIRYHLPTSGEVLLSVYNALGRQVATLVESTQQSGVYEIKFDAARLASGVYVVCLQTDKEKFGISVVHVK